MRKIKLGEMLQVTFCDSSEYIVFMEGRRNSGSSGPDASVKQITSKLSLFYNQLQ